MGGLALPQDSADGPSMLCLHAAAHMPLPAGPCHAPQPRLVAHPCCCLGHQEIWLACISRLPCQTQLVSSHNPSLPQILPLKETCGEFLFKLLTARNCLNLLLKLIEKYVCTRERRMLIQHMAQNFRACWRRARSGSFLAECGRRS